MQGTSMRRLGNRGVVGLVWLFGAGAVAAGCDAPSPQVQPPAPHKAQQGLGVGPSVSSGEMASSVAVHPPGTVQPPEVDLYDERLYVTTAIEDPAMRAEVEYGKALAEETWRYIGPNVEDPAMRMSESGLACKNCHIKAGAQPLSAPWVGVTKRYPNFRKRENRIGTIEDRINGCMERSMNGKRLADDSREMKALVAWMAWLSHLAPEDGKVTGAGFEVFPFPDRAVDLEHGEQVFKTRCVSCHQADGHGLENPAGGYMFPPLAGDLAYNDGAGMHRVLTAASFIRNNMPQGTTYKAPQLSVEEAFDVAGYINNLPRPKKADLAKDFPDRKLKPMSTPYGPYADEFPTEQHKFGPYREIFDYYEQTFGMQKKK